MTVKITSKRQVTFPARVLDALRVGPGDRLELEERPNGFILHLWRVDMSRLGTLQDKIRSVHDEPFDIHKFRRQPYGPSLRD